MPSLLLWGNMVETKQELINEFRERPDLRVLIATEVASEGVDLQFCHLLVNYDLPWNPMRVEQRIGRIDRLGQKAKVIHIWNLFYAETIDERIYGRLLGRLRIFEQTLGEPEPIIGETIKRLESRLLTSQLTREQEEAEIQRAAQVLENLRHRQDELEEMRRKSRPWRSGVRAHCCGTGTFPPSHRTRSAHLCQGFFEPHAPEHQFQQLASSTEFLIRL